MKKYFFLFFLMLFISSLISKPLTLSEFKSDSGYFIENKGQISDDKNNNSEVLFYTHSGNSNIYFMRDRICFVQNKITDNTEVPTPLNGMGKPPEILSERVDVIFEENNPKVNIFPEEIQTYKLHYYLNTCPDGIKNVKAYKQIIYKDVYSNIDYVFSIENHNISFKIHFKSESDLNKIRFKINGANLSLDGDNQKLIMTSEFGKNSINLPILQNKTNSAVSNNFIYSLKDNDLCLSQSKREKILGNFDVVWCTYGGGNNYEKYHSVRVDSRNDIVVGGFSSSSNYPSTPGVAQATNSGGNDMVISKFSSDGQLKWSTYYGGSSSDNVTQFTINHKDEIWAGGEIYSVNFPVTSGCFQANNAGYVDACAVKLRPDGTRLYATYYGGGGYDVTIAMAVDTKDNLWFTSGNTTSPNFPVTFNAFQSNLSGPYDFGLVKLDDNGNRLYATFVGGSSSDYGRGLATDNSDNVYIGGTSISTDFPIKGKSYQSQNKGNHDATIIKFDMNGKHIWSTYFGGSDNDYGNNLAIDHSGNVILSGVTYSSNIPVSSTAFQKSNSGGADLFLVKFTGDGDYLWSTYYGGRADEGFNTADFLGGNLEVDSKNNIATTLITGSSDLPLTSNALQNKKSGNTDAFVLVVDKDCKLVYSTYLGGRGEERGYGVTFDLNDNLYAVGNTNSSDFPVTSGCFQGSIKGDYDGYIVKFCSKLVINDSCDDTEFNFPEFSDVTDLIFKGFSFRKDKYLRVCPARDNYVGSIWYRHYVPIKYGFRTNFKFCMTKGENHGIDDRSLPGADGIAFVIQNISTDMSGISGGRMGYDPLPNSLAVEFDLYSNDSLQIENLYDPNGNHIAVFSNGTNPNSANHKSSAHKGSALAPFVMKSDSTIYFAQIEYKPANKELDVYLSLDSTFRSPVLTVKNIDIASLIKLDKDEFAYVGFTSATGQSFQNHDILAWTFCPVQTDGVPSFVESGEVNSQKSAFPNPADDWVLITIPYSGNQLVKLEIFDLMGKKYDVRYELINNGDSNDLKLSVQNLKKGIYFLKANQGTSVNVYKFIKN